MCLVSASIDVSVVLSVYLAVCINTKLFISLITLSSLMFCAVFILFLSVLVFVSE